jgi:hypothetical protein
VGLLRLGIGRHGVRAGPRAARHHRRCTEFHGASGGRQLRPTASDPSQAHCAVCIGGRCTGFG